MSTGKTAGPFGPDDSFARNLAAARAGSSDALGHLIGPMRPNLKQDAAQGMSPTLLRREDASDIVNTTYLKVVRDFHSFSGDQRWQFRAWVRAILSNTLLHLGRHYGSQKRNPRLEEPIGSEIENLERADRQPSPSSLLGRKEWKAEVRLAILRLSENHQRVLRLRYESQLEFGEVADRLGISVDATKQLWARAIKALATELRKVPMRRDSSVPRPLPPASAGP